LKFLEAYGKIANPIKEKAKRDWELQRLKDIKAEEERQAELEDEEMMYTYPKTEVNINNKKKTTKLLNPPPPPKTTTKTTRSSTTTSIITPTPTINSKSLIESELAKYNKLLLNDSVVVVSNEKLKNRRGRKSLDSPNKKCKTKPKKQKKTK
jgi:hypothetical protein